MPAPNHMACFRTKAEIEAWDFSAFPDGTPIACLENTTWYLLDKTSTATPDGEDHLSNPSGIFSKMSSSSGGGLVTYDSPPSEAPTQIGAIYIARLTDNSTTRTIEYIADGTESVSDWRAFKGSVIISDDEPSYYGFSEPEFPGQIWMDNSYNNNVLMGVDVGNGLEWVEIQYQTGSF